MIDKEYASGLIQFAGLIICLCGITLTIGWILSYEGNVEEIDKLMRALRTISLLIICCIGLLLILPKPKSRLPHIKRV